MIYCVVPQELVPELYDKLSSYYGEDPNVTVIVDRRQQGPRRSDGPEGGGHRERRDRRRPRVPGHFPQL